jgi:hypothetical protein
MYKRQREVDELAELDGDVVKIATWSDSLPNSEPTPNLTSMQTNATTLFPSLSNLDTIPTRRRLLRNSKSE